MPSCKPCKKAGLMRLLQLASQFEEGYCACPVASHVKRLG